MTFLGLPQTFLSEVIVGVFSPAIVVFALGILLSDSFILPRLEATAMGITVAISAERDQVFVSVVTQSASRANVVDLKTIGTAAVLASPAVTLQHFDTEFAIRIWIQPKSRSLRLEITHWTFPICCSNSVFCGSGSNE